MDQHEFELASETKESQGFPHERLKAYAAAREFHLFVIEIKDQLPEGTANLRDQLHRASTSMCLNLAEGASAFNKGIKKRSYRIALASAGECAAVLDLLKMEAHLDERSLAQARRTLEAMARLTVGLIRRF